MPDINNVPLDFIPMPGAVPVQLGIGDDLFFAEEPPQGVAAHAEAIAKAQAMYEYQRQLGRRKAPPKGATNEQLKAFYDKEMAELDVRIQQQEKDIWEMRRKFIPPEEVKEHLENYLTTLGVKVELKANRSAFTVFGEQLMSIFADKDDLVP